MRIALVGATGLVGRELLTLVPRAWPGAETILFASRDQSIEHDGKTYSVHGCGRLDTSEAPKGDLAMVALDDEHSRRYVPRLLELGYRVVDKSNVYRTDPAVPLIVAGVNDRLVTDGERLVANPNCTTIPLALVLGPLDRRFGIEDVDVATYQAVSGAGIAALDHFLEASAAGFALRDRLGSGFPADGYAGNVFPHHGGTDPSGFSAEERKLMFESRKIVRGDLAVSAQATRVPVALGHYEVAWVRLREATDASHLGAVLEGAHFLRFVAGSDGAAMNVRACATDRDRAWVGRVREPEGAGGKRFCVTLVGDNLRLGAATNAVRAASRWFPVKDAELAGPGI